MKYPNYGGRSQEVAVRQAKARIDAIERNQLQGNQAEVVANVHFMEHETSFVTIKTYGQYKGGVTGTTSAIDEDTNAAVVARTNLHDPFGDGVPVNNPLAVGTDRVGYPLDDNEGKVAYYHGYYAPTNDYRRNMNWDLFDASFSHTRLPIMVRSFEVNNPGSSSFDKDAFIYYESATFLNLTGNQSHAIWFWPAAIADPTEAFTYLQYRYIDASNWYAIVYETASPNHVIAFVTEGGTTTKREVTDATIFDAGNNGWQLVIWTYNPTTNALTVRLNNVADDTTPADTLAAPYTTNTNMYIGGVPLQILKRVKGWLGPYVMWNIILTGTQQTNYWTHGTIV